MLDYSALAALAAIIETQHFQKAAEKLFITQSAISQRLKALENYYGEPLLIRTLPYRPTSLGLALLRHYKHTLLLEDALKEELSAEAQAQRISVAISRDSLETWFVKVLDQLDKIQPLCLEISADDQDLTFDYFQKGLVSACASTQAKGLSGCKTAFLGYFDYVLVASPAFKKKYFSKAAQVRENLLQAPALIFDQNDGLHSHYLKEVFKISDAKPNYQMVPSVTGFRHFALKGYAYALIPEIDIRKELKEHKLVKLFPDKPWPMPVYWHYWSVETRVYKLFNELVIKMGRSLLRQA